MEVEGGVVCGKLMNADTCLQLLTNTAFLSEK